MERIFGKLGDQSHEHFEKINEIVQWINKESKRDRAKYLLFLKWHDEKFGSESSCVVIADIVDEYLNVKPD